MQFGFCGINLMMESDDVDDLTANTITMLFFTHSVVKLVYFAVRSKLFYRTLGIWNNPNSHPLFAESNSRYHQIAVKKMRILLLAVIGTTVLSAISWTTITFIGDSVKKVIDPVTNETTYVEVTRLFFLFYFLYIFIHEIKMKMHTYMRGSNCTIIKDVSIYCPIIKIISIVIIIDLYIV